MLTIVIPKQTKKYYDEINEEFIVKELDRDITIVLEHSLVSISKWESKWHKPFLSDGANNKKTNEELLDYIKCMTISQNIDDKVYSFLTKKDVEKINTYISNPMTATTFNVNKQNENTYKKKEVVTSELIYYWMFSNQIPKECEKWNINRLMTLLRVFGVKNDTSKMGKKDIYKQNRALNAARRARMGSKG